MMADCLTSPLKEIGKCILWPPVKRHFDYLWCFDSNIQGLRDGIRDLEVWEGSDSTTVAEANRIVQDDNIPKPWNIILRYSVGKNAKQRAEEIAKLQKDRNFSSRIPSHGSTMDFPSRKSIEKDIIESLTNSGVSTIGICGMGGVGKTSMVQRIWKRVREENLFDEVVMIVVSQQINMLKIQKEIADSLHLKFDEESMSARADTIRQRLMDTKKKIIIFDDVWESLRLEELGVPSESGFERCKILLTTRSKYICEEMEAQKVFVMGVLTEEEAWSLFKEKAGDCLEDSILRSVAKAVAAECKGLPIALVTVGKALRNKIKKSIWEDSLSQLRRSNPTDFKEVLVHVYCTLKLSYDYLGSERERMLILLCCLFPEDYDISVEQLVWYCMGLRIFDEIRSIEEARSRTHKLVEKLKSCFLLTDGLHEHHVKMHDVVRDMAIFIGSEVKDGFLKSLKETSMDPPRENSSLNCEWMSVSISNEIINLSLGLHFPNLHLLMLKSTSDKVCDISFEGMEDLIVLSFSEIEFPSLPRTLGLLKNLQTLHLYDSNVRDITVIGELASLEIFCCHRCDNIEELPAEIGRVNRLRLLELHKCEELKTIAFGTISSLVGLEELKIRGSFRGWEAEEKGKERRNAALTELQSLPNLTCLEIEIDDWNLAAQEIYLPQKLVKYDIHISDSCDYRRDHERAIHLKLPRNITIGKWIHILVRNTEHLELEGDGPNNFNLAESESLRKLSFYNCSTVKKLVNTYDQNVSSLCNLTSITMWKCSNLRYLFSVEMARSLLQLEDLEIIDCDTMEVVFWNEIKSITTAASIEFPKLKILELNNLPKLTAFCQGVESIHFPNLIKMEIEDLPMLNSLCPLNSDDDTSFHFLFNQKGSNLWKSPNQNASLCNLTFLSIVKCSNLRYLFTVEMAMSLLQLEELWIVNCDKMEEVFWNENKSITSASIEFPKLKKLKLSNLPNLTAFCQVVDSLHFSKLRKMKFENLPKQLAAQEIRLPQKLVKFRIHFVSYFKKKINKYIANYISYFGYEKEIILDLPRHIKVGEWIHLLVGNTEYLQLEGDGSNNLNLAESENLRILIFGNCSTVKKLVNTNDCKFGTVFPLLESLSLCNLEKLEEICDDTIPEGSSNVWKSPNQNVSLCNLAIIEIMYCSNLRSLFSVSTVRNLLQLEVLVIEYCDTMEQVFWNEITSITTASIEFPKLKQLTLRDLPNLTAFCQGVESIQFPNLTVVDIGYLPKFNGLCSLNSEPPHDDTSFHFLCNQKIEIGELKRLSLCNLKNDISNIWCHHISINFFGNLEELEIFSVNGIKNLLSSSIAKSLVRLKELRIRWCKEMIEVIEADEKDVVNMPLFPTLEQLEIIGLRKLRSFCQWKHALELLSLKNVEIDGCPAMKTFTFGSLSTPNISRFTINEKEIDDTKDLNGAIHHLETENWVDEESRRRRTEIYLSEEEEEEEEEEEKGLRRRRRTEEEKGLRRRRRNLVMTTTLRRSG